MLTEQEAVAQLNSKIKSKELKDSTYKFLDKINILKKQLENEEAILSLLQKQVKEKEKDIHKIKGAISILVELSAENEQML